MTMPTLPTLGSTSWYSWASAVHDRVSAGGGMISVTDYGALGNNSTDDRGAIETAAAAAVAAGKPLLIPGGKTFYTGTTSVTFPAGVQVYGWNATLRGAVAGAGAATIGSNTELVGLTIDNSSATDRHGISVRSSSSRIAVRYCKFINTPAVPINSVYIGSAGISDVTIENCIFDGSGYGILTNSAGTTGTPTGAYNLTRVKIVNNTFRNITGDAIELNHPFNTGADGTVSGAGDFTVSGNIISVPDAAGNGSSAGFGIGIAGVTGFTVTNNIITDARTAGIHVEDDARFGTIADNTVRNITGPDADAGIRVLTSCKELTVTGNVVTNVDDGGAGGGDCVGIKIVYAATTLHTYDVLITGNTVRGVSGIGISAGADSGQGGRWVIDGNIIGDCDGDGVRISGSPDEVSVTANLITSVGGAGISPDTLVGTAGHLIRVRDNVITGATGGDYRGVAITAGTPIYLADRTVKATTAGATGGGYASMPLFRIGSWAEGRVHVTGRRVGAASVRVDATYWVRWDGTTLVAHKTSEKTNGVISSDSLQMINGVLTWWIFMATDGFQLDGSATFEGGCVEDNLTYSTTVTATSMGSTPAAATDLATALTLVNNLRTKLLARGIVA